MFSRDSLFRNIVLVVLLCLLFLPLPANNLWWREVFNSGHTVLFALLSFVIYRQLKMTARFSNTLAIYPLVLFLGLLFGVLTELLQDLVQRTASLSDLYRDIFGLLAGLCLAAAYDKKSVKCKKVAVALLVAGSALLLLGISPLIQLGWFYAERQKAFPVIADFNASWSSHFVRLDSAEMLERTSFSRNKMLYPVRFHPGEYPGISVIEAEPDWSAYHSLRVNIFSENDEKFILTLRIHDAKHNQQYSDRFNKKLVILPGMTKIGIPLSKVALAPRGRDLDLENVAGVILFVNKLDEDLRLEISNIYLE